MGSGSSCPVCEDCGGLQEELANTKTELANTKTELADFRRLPVQAPVYRVQTGNQSGAQIILNPNARGQVIEARRAWGGSRRTRRSRRKNRKSHKNRSRK